MIPDPFLQLAVALGLGLLVGLQRERVDPVIAGIRTFSLITVLGALAALLGGVLADGSWRWGFWCRRRWCFRGTWCACRGGRPTRGRRRSSPRWSCTASGLWWS